MKILVDHTFIFTSAISKIKELIDSGEVGDILYFDSIRINLGLFRHDSNVIWDLAPHDFSILDFLLSKKPVSIKAIGKAHMGEYENIAYIILEYSNDLIAHININWLSPVKIRLSIIGGTKKMIVYDDMEPDLKIKIYDRGVNVTQSPENIYKMLVQYRWGDMYSPKLENTEALKVEINHFIDCIMNNKKPISDGHLGYRVVRLLELADESLKRKEVIEVTDLY